MDSCFNTDELLEYMWLKPQETGLNIDIFVDDGGAYVRNRHQPVVLVRDGYGREVGEFLAFAIGGKQNILSENINYHISNKEIVATKMFIKENQQLLLDFADGKIDCRDIGRLLTAFQDDLQSDKYGGVYTCDNKQFLSCPNVLRRGQKK